MQRRGLASSRQQARELITARRVLVAGALADKASRQVSASEPIELLGPPPRFVGRGGTKLDAALDRFAIAVAGRRCLDAGASTGGFTDALLQRGAEGVIAVDVGRNQLHEKLRADPRVEVRERTDIRSVQLDDLAGPVDVVVADLSFISTISLVDHLVGLLSAAGDLVVLVKPQFEAGRSEASRGKGVISDPAVWTRVLGGAIVAIEESGAAIMDAMVSPVRGAAGNVEFLVHGRRTARRSSAPPVDVADLVAQAESGTA